MVSTTNASTKDIRELAFFSKYGYTLKEITEYIGVHNNTMNRVIKELSGKMKSDIARPALINL